MIIIIVVVITFFPGGSALFSQADVYGPEMCADLSGARTVKATRTRGASSARIAARKTEAAAAALAARRDSRRRV